MTGSEGGCRKDVAGLAGEPAPGTTAKWAGGLVCPECEARFEQAGEKLACQACKKSWPIVNGIPEFVGNFPYWGEIPLAKMEEINRRARTGSWKAPLADSGDPLVERAASMILNLDRANWQWLLDLPAESRVLDLGAGMGTNAHALAAHYREVIAVEPVAERTEFMQQRFTQEKLDNIQIVRSSIWALPLAKRSVDLAVMNGVLEWVAEGRDGDPGEIQESALRRIHELLRPGGYLYLGIENRLGPGYFIGYNDPHCGIPFVTVLPRPLAHWYAKKRGLRGGYRNYLYSSRGYRRLLRRTGFSSVEVYVALPSYNHPRYLIPLQNNIFSYYSHNFNPTHRGRVRGIVYELLLKSGLLKYLEYSFVILARK